MDKYTRIVLTIIAVCLIALNIRVWVPEKSIAHFDIVDTMEMKILHNTIKQLIMRDCFVDPERKHFPSGNQQVTCLTK